MATSRTRRALVAGAAALAIGAAAAAQQSPESLLPPGFSDNAPTPSPAPAAAAPAVAGSGAAPPTAPRVTATTPAGPLPPLPPLAMPTPGATPTPAAPRYEMPAFARRSLAQLGPSDSFAADAFAGADGRYVERLMRRLSAPLPSRWLQIALRRLLAAELVTPAHVNGADFAAERAWLLLRMGESITARAVAQSVDLDRVTPKLRQVWMQAALATADPAALCALAPGAGDSEPGWIVARAMCAGLTGTGKTQPLLADMRRRRVASGIDLQLAQKVMGAGLDSRQAITIEWAPVTQLTAWRFGLATATGVAVPGELYGTVGPQVTAWRALAPAIPLAERAAVADRAAAMGALSSAALVDLYSALADGDDVPAPLARIANDLRDAYVGDSLDTRLAAMARLWDAAETPAARYGRLILTARAAARLLPAGEVAQADRLVASMLSAGLDRTAQRWRGHVRAGSDAWAMLLLADPDGGARGANPRDYAPSGANAERKKQLFFAGLAGLGEVPAADLADEGERFGVPVTRVDSWTRALDQAVTARQQGTVLLLAAVGLQARGWETVPAASLYRVVAALRAVGLDGEARMIAAEALARL
ncbi:hypothetical protein K7957_16780 [Sphingomonas yunnanensis]|uniref:hypothetical protein n=1 Tax=Sphingomonas yunnanensis TaxID=310400 RepID=UPI001CA6BCC4|nr:hypothetical protein [Sphingomonas yunnanensis]MBY9064595.1 hypothetical protein [Sphingomonas yunnanensis]